MAKNKSTVYLAYEDEPITKDHESQLNCTVNKIGGRPDWCNSEISITNCPLCGLVRPLIAQIFAPLENSRLNRTLFIFGCINPTCSVQSSSWICARVQCEDKTAYDVSAANVNLTTSYKNIVWCNDADDWDDCPDNSNEKNGNLLRNDNKKTSDDEDESVSMENDIVGGFDNLNIDDKNANCGAQGVAVGIYNSSNIYAELEGEESGAVSIETPIAPDRDLIALMNQTPRLPINSIINLNSFFLYVEEEKSYSSSNNDYVFSDHVRELLQEYQKHDEISKSNSENLLTIGNDFEQENYEKSVPLHGDVMFHNFLSVIQKNPGQILRYSRDAYPLLIGPLKERIPKCEYCGSECVFEVQILPTIIPKLKTGNNDTVPIEFGNVLIFTCFKSCWDTPEKMRLEHVIVQQE